MAKRKTPEYVLRAQRKYNEKFENAGCKLPLGTKERIRNVTDESINQFINRLVAAELERLESQ